MASEDSDQLSPGLLAIHRLSDLSDVCQPLKRKVATRLDQLNALRELLEVALLRRQHWMPAEEGNDRLDQIDPPPHNEAIQMLAVVVVAPIGDYLAHPEEVLEYLQRRDALSALCHGELMTHLIAGSVADSACVATLANEADREAAFSVYKTNNPA